MRKRMKVGIIGMGAIGPVHADAYGASPGEAELCGICDIDPEKLARHGDKHGIPQAGRFRSYRDLLASDIEAVDVCVGNTLHREIAVAALQAGKHVLLEKPMAMNAVEAAAILGAATRSGKTLQVGMVKRQCGDLRLVRQYVDDGFFGKIYHLRAVLIRNRGIPGLGGWFTTKAMSGGGPLIDIGVHWLDAAMHAAGLWKPTRVSAKCHQKFGGAMRDYRYVSMWAGPPKFDGVSDVEDYAAGMVRFGGEATMSFEFAWAANAADTEYIEILGDKAGARIFTNQPLKIMTEIEGGLAEVIPCFPDPGNVFHLQAKAFLAACRGEAEPAATGQEGLTVMKLIDAIYESDRRDAEVEID